MASLQLRWSEAEARKPYARPFMVTFLDDDATPLGSVAVNGSDLLYQRQFVVAVAALAGELFAVAEVAHSADPQGAWLDTLAPLLPAAAVTAITPRSTFDPERGRLFSFVVEVEASPAVVVAAPTLLDYQEFQAAVAHQSGRLLRVAAVEATDDALGQRRAWDAWLAAAVARPDRDDALAATWPWR